MKFDRFLICFSILALSTALKITRPPDKVICDCTARIIPSECFYHCYPSTERKPTTSVYNSYAPRWYPSQHASPWNCCGCYSFQQQPRQQQPFLRPQKPSWPNIYPNYPQTTPQPNNRWWYRQQQPRQPQPNPQPQAPRWPNNYPIYRQAPQEPSISTLPPGWRGQNCPNGICPQLPQRPELYGGHWYPEPIHVLNRTSSCEPYGCGYNYGESYGYSWTTLYADYPGHADYTRMNAAVRREILSTMPSIGYCLGNNLFFTHPSFARYIIAKHSNVPKLLAHMDEPVLYKMINVNPSLQSVIASFPGDQIGAIFERIYNHCHFLQRFSKKNQNIIIIKVKDLEKCRPTPTTTTRPLFTMPAPEEPVEPLYTEDEIATLEAKIPKARKLLDAIPLDKANIVRKRSKIGVVNIFLRLPSSVIEKINNFLDATSDPGSMSPLFIAERIIGDSTNLYSILVKQLFV